MKVMNRFHPKFAFVVIIVCVLSVGLTRSEEQEQKAQQILDTTGVKGGFIIYIGCGDGKLTAALEVSDKFLVQGLDTNALPVFDGMAAAGGRLYLATTDGAVLCFSGARQ